MFTEYTYQIAKRLRHHQILDACHGPDVQVAALGLEQLLQPALVQPGRPRAQRLHAITRPRQVGRTR